MDCLEFENQLQDGLDQRRDPRTLTLRTHAADCHSCRASLADAMLILRGVEAWRKSLPAVDLANRIHMTSPEITADKPQVVIVRQRTDRVPAGILVSAVVTAAAICLMFLAAPNPIGSQANNRSVARSNAKNGLLKTKNLVPSTPQVVPAAPENANLETVLASAEGAYSHLAQETAAVAQDFALLMPKGGLFRSTSAPGKGSEVPARKPSGMVPPNVYPVGDSVENALQLLWQAVPGMEKNS